MGDPLTILSAILGAGVYAGLGLITRDRGDPSDKFSADRLVPTFIATLAAAVLLFLTDQPVTAQNATTYVLGNVGLAAGADKAWRFIKARLFG